jgi:hypothetical protein
MRYANVLRLEMSERGPKGLDRDRLRVVRWGGDRLDPNLSRAACCVSSDLSMFL